MWTHIRVRACTHTHTKRLALSHEHNAQCTFRCKVVSVLTCAQWLVHSHVCNGQCTLRFTVISVLTYEISWVVLWHHSQANITEEVHYFVDVSKVGSLCRQRKGNTIICAISIYCSLQKQRVIPILWNSFPCYSVVCCSENCQLMRLQ